MCTIRSQASGYPWRKVLMTRKEREQGFHHADNVLFLDVDAGYVDMVSL